ncbi:hypothetical protein LEP1GSC127_4462 [Leptospira kirschneri str. 200801925]|nr:hypothetical protein LEP1GSC127_4462 [Leptospira kirschneri str. 200801925]
MILQTKKFQRIMTRYCRFNGFFEEELKSSHIAPERLDLKNRSLETLFFFFNRFVILLRFCFYANFQIRVGFSFGKTEEFNFVISNFSKEIQRKFFNLLLPSIRFEPGKNGVLFLI